LRGLVGGGWKRSGGGGAVSPADARALLSAWIGAVGVEDGGALIEEMQQDGFRHRDLFRRGRSIHDARLREAAAAAGERIAAAAPGILSDLFTACLPVVPY